jgi:hypothetical protein
MTATIAQAGIARRKNGVPPPGVPLADIDLGSREFWESDDDLRDGAFATLRRESPIAFSSSGAPRLGAGRGPLGTHDVR